MTRHPCGRYKVHELTRVRVLIMKRLDDDRRNLRFMHLANEDVPDPISADYSRVEALVSCQPSIEQLLRRIEPVSEPSVRVLHELSEHVIHLRSQCIASATANIATSAWSQRIRLSAWRTRVTNAVFIASFSVM